MTRGGGGDAATDHPATDHAATDHAADRETIGGGRDVDGLRAGGDPWVLTDAVVGAAVGTAVTFDDATLHHLRRVRRLGAGAGVVATAGDGLLVAGRLTSSGMEVDVVAATPAPRPRLRVVQGLAKRSRHDEVVRMLTELGVDWITAASTARSQVDLGRKVDRVQARWAAIVDSACSQSRRSHRPVVDGPISLRDALPGQLDRVLVAHPAATTNPLDVIAAQVRTHDPRAATPGQGSGAAGNGDDPPAHVGESAAVWTAVVGPEGGFTEAEVADLVERGAHATRLGASILRTEHAGLALAAVMAAGLGRM